MFLLKWRFPLNKFAGHFINEPQFYSSFLVLKPHREGNKVTNHSVRKTCISRLLDADVPEDFVSQLSGQKSMESLQSYKSAITKHQKRTSLTFSRADLSGSRDEALSSVHNQGFEEVTRSTTDIVRPQIH